MNGKGCNSRCEWVFWSILRGFWLLDIEKDQFPFLLLFSGKGNVRVLSVDVFVKTLQFLCSMCPNDRSVIDISEPYCRRGWSGAVCKAVSSRCSMYRLAITGDSSVSFLLHNIPECPAHQSRLHRCILSNSGKGARRNPCSKYISAVLEAAKLHIMTDLVAEANYKSKIHNRKGRLETRDILTSKVFVSRGDLLTPLPVAYFALVIDFRSF